MDLGLSSGIVIMNLAGLTFGGDGVFMHTGRFKYVIQCSKYDLDQPHLLNLKYAGCGPS